MLGEVWIDLHCHSVHSDGSEPASVVAERAAQRGVELFCLTDHDSCEGYLATLGACRHVLRGLELSCSEDGRTVHLLLYDVARDEARWAGLEARLRAVREDRMSRLREIGARLSRLGVTVDVDSIIATAGGRSVGRPDVARALVAAGVVRSIDEAFDRFLADGRQASVPVGRMSVAQGLALGSSAGARISLAHPHTLGEAGTALISRYRHQGLEGLECFYGKYTTRQRKRWVALARRLDLVVTGGSDFHGRFMPQVPEPGIELPALHAERLCRWLEL